MSFRTFNPSSKYGIDTSKPPSRSPLGAAGQVADHQPCWPLASVGQESADKENTLPEYRVRPIATNSRLRAPTVASNNAGTITAIAYSRVSPGKKVARPALLIPPSSPSPSSPTKPTTSRPRKLAGKRNSPSDNFAGPSNSPPKRARRIEKNGSEISASSHLGLSSGSNSRPITPPPSLVSTRDTATSPPPSLGEVRPKMPESVLGRPKLREQYTIEATSTSHRSPSEDGDKTTNSNSDPSNARGGRENSRAATMAMRIAEVHRLEDHYNDLMAILNGGDQMEDPFTDNNLEDNFAAANAAYEAWQNAKLRLSSPASASPSTSTTRASSMSSAVLNSPRAENNTPHTMDIIRGPSFVLMKCINGMLPRLPSPIASNGDTEAEAVEISGAQEEDTGGPYIDPLPPASMPPASEDPQSEGVSPPVLSTPPSESAPVGVQDELPEDEGVPPSASSTPPVPEAPTTSSSAVSTASAPFRFSGDDEAILLGHVRAKRYPEATNMLPQEQRWRVITTPAEIAAVRLVHPRRTAKPTNKGKRVDSAKSRNRETRSHIGKDGAEIELWVCRASFKVEESGVSYSGSPCGMPVGTKDSWKRHLKEKHFGREKRG